jgi:hypothetical protein
MEGIRLKREKHTGRIKDPMVCRREKAAPTLGIMNHIPKYP